MNNTKRNATAMHTDDFTQAFIDWESSKNKAVSDLVKAASKLWSLGVPASLLTPVIKNVCRDLEEKEVNDLEN